MKVNSFINFCGEVEIYVTTKTRTCKKTIYTFINFELIGYLVFRQNSHELPTDKKKQKSDVSTIIIIALVLFQWMEKTIKS